MSSTLRRAPRRAARWAAILTLAISWCGAVAACRAQYINGVDISMWQGTVNWTSIKNAGNDFAFVKATEGIDYTDPRFTQNISGALAAGIYVGTYHYGSLGVNQSDPNDAINEANDFVDAIAPYYAQGGNLLRPVVDVETLPTGLGSVAAERAFVSKWTRDFIGVVKNRLGFAPIIYCNTNYATNYFESNMAQYDLWVANYNYAPPTIPPASIDGVWNGWDFWQYTDKGSVSGVSGNVDRNVYQGTLSEMLAEFLAKPPAPSPNGDFDDNGVVDGADFLAWQRNYPLWQDASRQQGDANDDGVVNALDFSYWKLTYGPVDSEVAMSAVPEPAAAALTALALMFVRRRRR